METLEILKNIQWSYSKCPTKELKEKGDGIGIA
jgi:hypothetical protein